MDVHRRHGARGTTRRAALAAAACLVLLVAFPADRAGAHAYLTAAEPAPAAELAEAPDELVLTFEEPVVPAGNALTVIDGRGREHRPDAEAGTGPGQIRADLDEELAPGEHRVVWRVLPADGHVLEGAFTFTVAPVPTSAATPSEEPAGGERTTAGRESGVPGAVAPVTGVGAAEAAAPAPTGAGSAERERTAVVGAARDGGSWPGALALLAGVGVVATGLVRRGRRDAAGPGTLR